MKTKTIIFKTGAEELTYEETRVRFLPLAHKYINRFNSQFNQKTFEPEDIMQHVEVEIWKGYEQYDPTLGYCFSTYVVPKIQKGIRDATHKSFAGKRQGVTVSSSAAMYDDADITLEDTLTDGYTIEESFLESEMLDKIKAGLEINEMECVQHILDPKSMPATEIAEIYGISRQAANKRVRKVKEKLKEILGGN